MGAAVVVLSFFCVVIFQVLFFPLVSTSSDLVTSFEGSFVDEALFDKYCLNFYLIQYIYNSIINNVDIVYK